VEGRRRLEKRLATVGVPHDNFVRREGVDHLARDVVLHRVGPVSRLEQPRTRQERKRGDDDERQGRGCDAGRGDGVRQAEHAGAEDEVDGEVEDASGGLILHWHWRKVGARDVVEEARAEKTLRRASDL